MTIAHHPGGRDVPHDLTIDPSRLIPTVPDPGIIRERLALLMTEAALLRRQLRLSNRAERERDRLRELIAHPEASHASP